LLLIQKPEKDKSMTYRNELRAQVCLRYRRGAAAVSVLKEVFVDRGIALSIRIS